MNFTKDANSNMTSLQGYITAYYHQIEEIFGEPDHRNGDKTTVEWCLQFDDGTVATIYDWKEYETPFGKYRWHIGGRNQDAVDRIYEAMGVTA